jgi:hypothetical protein
MRENVHRNIDVVTFYEKIIPVTTNISAFYSGKKGTVPLSYKNRIIYNNNEWGLIGSDNIDKIILEQVSSLLYQKREEEAISLGNLMSRYRDGIFELINYFYSKADLCIFLSDAVLVFKGAKNGLKTKKNFLDFLGIPDTIEAGKENKIDKEKEI